MSTLTDIPEEILFKIVGYLQNERQTACPFNPDPSVTKDLQNIRLVCHRLASLGASFLFENIICDEELYTSENIFRIIDFATQYPHLALQVRRLQWKVAPNCAGVHELASTLAIVLQRPIDSVDIQWMYMLLLKPYQGQIRNRNRMSVFEPCSQEDLNVPLEPEDLDVYRFLKLRSVIELLPNLYHLEIASSTNYRRYTKNLAASRLPERARDFQLGFEHYMKMAEDGNLGALCNEVLTEGVSRVASLKLLDGSFTIPVPLKWQKLQQLEHLDLQMRPYWLYDESLKPDRSMSPVEYGQALRHLNNLRTLRLTALGNWATTFFLHYRPEPNAKDFQDTAPKNFYVDSLLEGAPYPHLISLTLVHFPARETGLCRIIRGHPKLRYLELRKLTMELPIAEYPRGGPNSWKRVATACADVPALRRVIFKNLRFYADRCSSEDNGDPASIQDIRQQPLRPQAIPAMYLLASSIAADGWIQRDDSAFNNFVQVMKAFAEMLQ